MYDYLLIIATLELGILSCNGINPNNKSLQIKMDYLHLIHLSLAYLAISLFQRLKSATQSSPIFICAGFSH